MQTYPEAFNSRLEVVHIDREVPGGGPYTCLGCGAELIAHLKDDKIARHFAHYEKGKCSGETQLHVLAKHIFKHTWLQCRQDRKPFILSLPRRFVCPHRSKEQEPCEIRNMRCTLGYAQWMAKSQTETRTEYDLAQMYAKIKMEEGDAGFIPDLLLISVDGKKKLYIEIKVKSPVSEEKAAAGHRIIEIPIRTRADLYLIDQCYLSVPEVKQYNFKLDTPVKNVPANCEILQIRERVRQQEEARLRIAAARLREEEAAQERREAQAQARLQQEEAALEAIHVKLKAEGRQPGTPREWSYKGHRIRIFLQDDAWILSVDREYHNTFDTFGKASERAEKLMAKFGASIGAPGSLTAGKVRDPPSEFVEEVIAIFGGRLLDDDE